MTLYHVCETDGRDTTQASEWFDIQQAEPINARDARSAAKYFVESIDPSDLADTNYAPQKITTFNPTEGFKHFVVEADFDVFWYAREIG